MPNTTSAPTRSSAYTSACAPVARVLPGLVTCARGGSDPTPCPGVSCAGVPCAGMPWRRARSAPGWTRRPAAGLRPGAAGRRRGRVGGAASGRPGPAGWDPKVRPSAGRPPRAAPYLRVPCGPSSARSSVSLHRLGSGGIKNPLVPDGSRGERAVSCLVSCLRAGQVRGSACASRVSPYCHPETMRQPLTRVVSHSETDRPFGPSPASSDVLIRASTPGAPIGLPTRNPCP